MQTLPPHSRARDFQRRPKVGERLRRVLARDRYLSVLLVFVLTVAAVSLMNPAFLSGKNLVDLLVQAAPVMIIGCGMTFVVLTGEIDISVGSQYGLLAALIGITSSPGEMGWSTPAVVGVILLAGLGLGLINGLLVAVARVPSIIATLGMLTILRGITDQVMGGEWITDLPEGIRKLGTGTLGGVPVCLVVAGIVIVLTMVLARRTQLGLKLYAVGGNPDGAACARISPTRVRLFAFALTGLFTSVAALVAVPQQSVIESGIGAGMELVVVTAVLVGGTSIHGGRGGVIGTVIAALLLGSVRTILVFINLGEMLSLIHI